MSNKFTAEELNILIEIFKGERDLEDFSIILEDSGLIEDFFRVCTEDLPEQESEEIQRRFYEELARKTKITDIPQLIDFMDESYISAVINNPDFFDGKLKSDTIANLILSTNDSEYIREALESDNLNFELRDKRYLDSYANYLDGLGPEPEVYAINENPLYTKQELYAAKVYANRCPGGCKLGSVNFADATMDMMLTPGISAEVIRLFNDKRKLRPGILLEADKMLEISTDLFAVMYKYGKGIKEPVSVRSVNRSNEFDSIAERESTVSNFWTTSESFDAYCAEDKKDVTLTEVTINPGTSCVDLVDVLNLSFSKDYVRNIVIAPTMPIEYSKLEMTDSEMEIKDKAGNSPTQKVEMRVSAPKKVMPLTPKETEAKKAAFSIYSDKDLIDNAHMFLEYLQKSAESGMKIKDALASIDPAMRKDYVRWKSAFQACYRYATRERSLQIDKEFEKFKIDSKDFKELAINRHFKGIENSLDNAINFAKSPDKLRKEEISSLGYRKTITDAEYSDRV